MATIFINEVLEKSSDGRMETALLSSRVVNQKVEDLNVVIPRKENLPWAVLSATVHLSLMLYLDCEFSSTYFLFVQNFCISIFLHTVLGCLVLMKKSSIFFQKPQKKSTFYNFPS